MHGTGVKITNLIVLHLKAQCCVIRITVCFLSIKYSTDYTREVVIKD
jgi:hypothetical protein